VIKIAVVNVIEIIIWAACVGEYIIIDELFKVKDEWISWGSSIQPWSIIFKFRWANFDGYINKNWVDRGTKNHIIEDA